MRVLVAGGGSGGHVMPALAVSAALKRRGADILFVGSRRPEDGSLVRQAGFDFRAITAGKLRRYLSLRNFLDPFKVLVGVWQSWRIIRELRPEVVFAKGDYVSFPVVWAAKLRRVPVVMLELDRVPALATRLMARRATAIAVAYPIETVRELPADKLTYTGNPIREGVIKGKADRAIRRYRLSKKLPTLLVLGGSQGAQAINQALTGALPDLLPECQIVHQTGNSPVDDATARALPKEIRDRYHPQAFFGPELFDLYATTDLAVSRAGAGALAELAAAGLPSVLIPHLQGGSGHQVANAEAFAETNAAVLLEPDRLNSAELSRVILALLHDGQRRTELGRNARKLAVVDAAKRVTDLVWETGTRGR